MFDRVFPYALKVLGGAGVVVGVVAYTVVLSRSCDSPADPAPRAELPPGPPPRACEEELCDERPAVLVCAHRYGGQYCERYRVEYERRCECARYAGDPEPPAPAGAGVLLGASPCSEDLCEDRTAWSKTDGPDAGVLVEYERRCECRWPAAPAGAP